MENTKQQRNTRQRQVVLDELRKVSSHPTAGELFEIVRVQLPKISLGTVYRNLEVLAQAGKIRKIELGGGETRFDGDTRPRYHVRCTNCGQLEDVHTPTLELNCDELREKGYEVLGHRLEFVAVCPKCAGAESEKHTDRLQAVQK